MNNKECYILEDGQFVRVIENRLEEDEKDKVEEHLKVCNICQERLESLKEITNKLKAFYNHPSEEDLLLFMDKSNLLDNTIRQKIETHLKEHQLCQDEINFVKETLQEFEKEISSRIIQEFIEKLKEIFITQLVLGLLIKFRERRRPSVFLGAGEAEEEIYFDIKKGNEIVGELTMVGNEVIIKPTKKDLQISLIVLDEKNNEVFKISSDKKINIEEFKDEISKININEIKVKIELNN